jgi:cytochrome c553
MRISALLIPLVILMVGVQPARAEDEIDPIVAAHAERVAIGTCAACHGVHGVSQQPKYPRLAGQNANYLAAQLRAFRGQTRGDPDAVGYMWGMSATLEDATVDALAAYYARQPSGPGRAGTDATVSRGRDIYEHGIEAVGVPACSACHGPDARGIADFPRLAGQHAQYILKQLTSFQNNMRNVAVMHGVAQGLKGDEMHAVAAYLESLP